MKRQEIKREMIVHLRNRGATFSEMARIFQCHTSGVKMLYLHDGSIQKRKLHSYCSPGPDQTLINLSHIAFQLRLLLQPDDPPIIGRTILDKDDYDGTIG